MSGYIIDDGIAVNYWAQTQQKILRFLTNIHYCNSKITLSKDVDRIFTTKTNFDFLVQRLEKPQPNVIACPLNQRFQFVDKTLNLDFCATFIDANYSPGSAMILFEGTKQGNILYTGNFRFTAEMNENPVFKEYIDGQKKLDEVYLDTKYLWPTSVLSLPTKRDVLFTVANIIRNNPAHKINISVTRCVMEEVTIALTTLVNQPIWVDQKTLDNLKLLRVHNTATNEETKCQIFIHSLMKYSLNETRSDDNIRIILRAQVHTEKYEKFRNHIQLLQKRIYFFPYSSHSTPNELEKMLQKLKPTSIIPINVSAKYISYAQQFVMNFKSVWTEKQPMTLVKRNTQEEKLYFWKHLGKMERLLQSDNFSHCKQFRKADAQQITIKINGSEMIEKRKVTQNNVYRKKNKLSVSCDKTVHTNQETDRDMSGEHNCNFQYKYKKCCKVVEQTSTYTLNGNYKNNEQTCQKKETHKMKADYRKESTKFASGYQVSKDTRQRRKELYKTNLHNVFKNPKEFREVNLKELCLKSKCTVQVTDIHSSKLEFMRYLGLKQSRKSKNSRTCRPMCT